MKSLLISLLLIGSAAMAADTAPVAPTTPAAAPHLSCVVPVENGTSTIKLEVTLGTDASIDFVTLTLTGPGTNAVLFTQMDKGAFAEGLSQGVFQTLVLQENFVVADGAYKNAGLVSLQKDANGDYTGLMAALGNIYPLTCK